MDDEYRQLEAIVAALLKEAGAEELVNIFAKNRITIETMMTFGDEDLAALGVEDAEKRRAVLKQIHVRTSLTKFRKQTDRQTDRLTDRQTLPQNAHIYEKTSCTGCYTEC